jgi:hypothetical protein
VVQVLELETPSGPARVQLEPAEVPTGALVLGHGAGGGVAAKDLVTSRDAALEAGFTVALVEQPYRVAGRRSTPAPHLLDAAWIAVLEALRDPRRLGELALITGGRSSGARVACRTAQATGAQGVLCLAFPLQPSRRRRDGSLAPSRLAELESAGVPVLVVQGESDPFGMPPAGPDRRVVALRGDHSLRGDLTGLREAVGEWLAGLVVRRV